MPHSNKHREQAIQYIVKLIEYLLVIYDPFPYRKDIYSNQINNPIKLVQFKKPSSIKHHK